MPQYRFAYNSKNQIADAYNLRKSGHESPPYSCIHCGKELIPKLGKVKEHHFAHKVLSDCSFESYLHSVAKLQIYTLYSESIQWNIPFYIEVYKDITPRYLYGPHNRYGWRTKKAWPINIKRFKSHRYNLLNWYDKIFVEKSIDSFRPDIALYSSDKKSFLFIEICVTSHVSKSKKEAHYRTIEIIIRNETDIQELKNRVLSCKNENISFYNFRK